MNVSRGRKHGCSESGDKSDSRSHSGELGMGNLKVGYGQTGKDERHNPEYKKMLGEREAWAWSNGQKRSLTLIRVYDFL